MGKWIDFFPLISEIGEIHRNRRFPHDLIEQATTSNVKNANFELEKLAEISDETTLIVSSNDENTFLTEISSELNPFYRLMWCFHYRYSIWLIFTIWVSVLICVFKINVACENNIDLLQHCLDKNFMKIIWYCITAWSLSGYKFSNFHTLCLFLYQSFALKFSILN